MMKSDLFQIADNYKSAITANRPMNPEEIKQLDNYFKIDLTYSSNALEGNTLTLSETKILLEDGITVSGKPLKDYLEADGHSKAFDYLLKIARNDKLVVTEEMILHLHQLFYSGIDNENAGKYRSIQVFITGTEYVPPKEDKVPLLMKELIKKINDTVATAHPIEAAALAHKWLVDIHPFVDGNGRTARLLMNLILINKGYGVVSIPPVLRKEYIESLRLSQQEKNPSNDMFINLIAECAIETQRDMCRMLDVNTRDFQYQEISPKELAFLQQSNITFEKKEKEGKIIIKYEKTNVDKIKAALNSNNNRTR